MRLHLVSFYGVVDESQSFSSSAELKNRQELLNKTAKQFGGIDRTHPWNLNKLKNTRYYENNYELLSRSRGCGYWAWKPFIILETFKKMNDGDYVFYCDVGRPYKGADFDHGNQITESLSPIVEWAEKNGGMMPGVYLPHHGNASIWIKGDCFKIMNCEGDEYKTIPTIQAGYSVWKKSPTVIEFLEEWKTLNLDSRLISDEPNTLGEANEPGFIRHCHDQAVLTLLCAKTKVKAFGDPKYQFWGFRNINFIAKQASLILKKKARKLRFQEFNDDYNAVPKFLTNWIELLYCDRRQEAIRMMVMGDDDLQVDMWTRYFPKASVLSEKYVEPHERIADSERAVKHAFDLVITNAMSHHKYTIEVFLRIYISLREGGAALIGPLPNSAQDLDDYARSIANSNHFPQLMWDAALPKESPKIHNSKNPVFLQSGLNRFILFYKPKQLINAEK